MKTFKDFMIIKEGEEQDKLIPMIQNLLQHIGNNEHREAFVDLMKDPGNKKKWQTAETILKDGLPTWENGKDEAQKLYNWMVNRKGVHTKNINIKKASLASLVKQEKYDELKNKLNELKNNDNKEVAKESKLLLSKVNKLTVAASVVTEAEDDETLKAEILKAAERIDDLLMKDGDDAETVFNNKMALKKMKNVFKQLYDECRGGNYKSAAAFLKAAAALSSDSNTLSYNELKLEWNKVRKGEEINADEKIIWDEKGPFQKGVKLLLGCLILKIILKSDIFTSTGELKKDEGIDFDSALNDALALLPKKGGGAVLNIDKSITDKFEGISSSKAFVNNLGNFLNKLKEKDIPEPDMETTDNTPEKAEETPEDETGDSETDETENSEGENEEGSEEENSEGENEEGSEEEPKKEEPKKFSGTASGLKFRVSLDDKPEEVNDKVEDFFGQGENSLFNVYRSKLEEYSKVIENRVKKANNEPVEEGIYSIVKDEVLNERMGAFLKNKFLNVGRTGYKNKGEEIKGSFESTAKDMDNYQQDFQSKAEKLAGIITSRIESTASQENAVRKLNMLAVKYEGRLRDCYVHATQVNSLNEIGRTKADIKDATDRFKNKVSNAYENSKAGKVHKADQERIENSAKNFGTVWEKMNNLDKMLIAHAAFSKNLSLAIGASSLMYNGQPVKNVLDKVTDTLQKDRNAGLKNKNEVLNFLEKIHDTDWFQDNRADLMELEQRYIGFENAVKQVRKQMPDILKAVSQNQVTQTNQTQAPAQTARNNELAQGVQNAAAQQPEQNQQVAKNASVITESANISFEDAKKVVNVLKNLNENACETIAHLFGNFDKAQIYNALLYWKTIPGNLEALANVSRNVQPSVTTSSVGTVYPNRVYSDAMRRKINPYLYK